MQHTGFKCDQIGNKSKLYDIYNQIIRNLKFNHNFKYLNLSDSEKIKSICDKLAILLKQIQYQNIINKKNVRYFYDISI